MAYNTTVAVVDEERYLYATSIASMLIVCLGLLGNGLGGRLMLADPMRPYASSIFLMFVCISDSVILIYEVLDDIAVHIQGWDVTSILYGTNEWRCRLGIFFYEIGRITSSWVVVAMAVELALALGLKSKEIPEVYDRSRNLYVSLAICLISIAGCFPFLVIVSAEKDKGCNSQYAVFKEVYSLVVLNIVVNCILPLVLILLACLRSLYQLSKQREAKNAVQFEPKSEEEEESHLMPNAVISMCVVFYISTLPVTAIDLAFFLQRIVPSVTLFEPYWKFAHIVSKCIFLLNFSAKFYLIMFFEPAFKKSFSYVSSCGLMTPNRSSAYLYEQNRHNVPQPTRQRRGHHGKSRASRHSRQELQRGEMEHSF